MLTSGPLVSNNLQTCLLDKDHQYWIEQEISESSFKDARLKKRFHGYRQLNLIPYFFKN